MTESEIKRLLREHGWRLARRGKKHDVYVKDGVDYLVSVPRHKGDLKKGTANAILKDAGIDARA